jgi:hypothetical protein
MAVRAAHPDAAVVLIAGARRPEDSGGLDTVLDRAAAELYAETVAPAPVHTSGVRIDRRTAAELSEPLATLLDAQGQYLRRGD